MGSCHSAPVDEQTQEIDKLLLSQNKEDNRVKEIVLLGTEFSGKSTIFKQLEDIYNMGYEIGEDELDLFIHKMRQNIIDSMLTLLLQSQQLSDTNPTTPEFQKCLVDTSDQNIYKTIKYFTFAAAQCSLTNDTANLLVYSYIHCYENTSTTLIPSEIVSKIIEFNNIMFGQLHEEMKRLVECIDTLWNSQAIQNTFSHRGYKYSFPDNMEHFFNHTERIFASDFFPSKEDVLKCNVDVNKRESFYNYVTRDASISILIHNYRQFSMFYDIDAIIFVAALNDFYKIQPHNGFKNAMHESIELFDEIVNLKWFEKTECVLFLNKNDLFRESLRDGHSLKECFSVEHGWNGEQWDESNDKYDIMEYGQQDDELFEKYCSNCIAFITDQYLKRNANPTKRVRPFLTTSTNSDCIRKVFWDVQNIVIRCKMARGGS